jgi:hypothetical protein
MTEDNKDTENILKTWAETQQTLLSNWLDTVRKTGGTSAVELWSKTVDAWQSSVKETLDAQAEWAHRWTATLEKAKGTPEEMRGLAKEGREQLQNWAEAQRELWQGWFNAVREINFKPEAGAASQTGKDLVQLWQDSAHKMIDAQAALVRRWTGGNTKKSQ